MGPFQELSQWLPAWIPAAYETVGAAQGQARPVQLSGCGARPNKHAASCLLARSETFSFLWWHTHGVTQGELALKSDDHDSLKAGGGAEKETDFHGSGDGRDLLEPWRSRAARGYFHCQTQVFCSVLGQQCLHLGGLSRLCPSAVTKTPSHCLVSLLRQRGTRA